MKHVDYAAQRTVCVVVLIVSLFGLGSCSIQQYALDTISDALTGEGGSDAFMGDNDPQLVADSLPFAIKMYESLLIQNPQHAGLMLSTGSLYVMYANAFLQGESLYLDPSEYEQKKILLNRAKNLYLRGKDYSLDYLELQYPGMTQALSSGQNLDAYLSQLTVEDVPYAYWALAGWFGAISIDSFDLQLAFAIPSLMALYERSLELDGEYSDGALYELGIQLYSAVPPSLGGSPQLAEESFMKAVELQQGKSASPYVSYAVSVLLPMQDRQGFTEQLNAALEIDPDAYPTQRLLNTISQQKAQWYLEHIDDFFL